MRLWRTLIIAFVTIIVVAAVCADWLIQRGFRANTPVPRWEASLARRVRNASIPGAEREKRNPLPPDAKPLSDGRDAFLSHCATCHGIDGSGKTPVGANLYPRVPDLHSVTTQNLSDGEIHYIIENGVQLTGMPAWSKSGSQDDIWKLVLFVRSLGSPGSRERAQQTTNMASAHYAG